MNQQQIKQLETELWASADNLRANSKLTAAEYKDPVLGLILLHYAQNRYEQAKVAIEASMPEPAPGRLKQKPTKAHFLAAGAMLVPEQSQYDYLANLPESIGICEALNTAMRLIEEEYADLAGIRRLQQEVNISVSINDNEVRETDYVDLSTLDFDKLRSAFAKSKQKNAVVFDLQAAIQKKLEQMVQQNPIRLEFYEKYKQIIEEYNKGKDIQAEQKAFDDLNDFMENDLTPEAERAMREGLNEETLAIFDLLKKPELTKNEEAKVKEVAKQTLAALKAEKLKIDRWRESIQVTAQVKTMIDHNLQWLPPESYPDEELDIKSMLVYQHIYANYQGSGMSRYG